MSQPIGHPSDEFLGVPEPWVEIDGSDHAAHRGSISAPHI
jgi:hypothetical protein